MKKTNGITLIALIITVIVMLILVSVTVSVVINSNLIGVAQNVADATEAAYENEKNLSKITIGGVTYPSLEAYTTGWDATSGVNYPKLASGMKAVYWDNTGNEIVQGDEKFNWNNWFDYKAQATGVDGTSRWANAKTEDGSYWVWIPRFEYKITQTTDTTPSDTNAGTIDVRFISTDVKKGSAGYTTTNGITVSSDNYIIHPAFTSNVDVGGFGKELAGFWVAKYEMSMEGKNDNEEWKTLTPTIAESETEISGNVATTNTLSTSNVTDGTNIYKNIRIVSKPGVSSWRYINISNAYENAYNYDRKKDSHLMKNSEWGAVSYLTHSQYGRNGEKVTFNNIGYVSAEGGIGTSSTGNVTGIYDLAGASYEYVALFNKAHIGEQYSTVNSRYCSNSGKNIGVTGITNRGSTKYLTEYNNNTNYINFKDLEGENLIVSIKGDAVQEVYVGMGEDSVQSVGWYYDCLNFVTSTNPTIARGGYYENSEKWGGLFASTVFDIGRYSSCSFRVVCAF